MNEMSEPAYCNHYHSRNAGWRLDPTSDLWVAECGKPSKATWLAAQDKEIEMTENEQLISEDERAEAAEQVTAEVEAAVNEMLSEPQEALPQTPAEIRALRMRLGLSRKQVQDGTGLGASVVWRVEQDGKDVDPIKRTLVVDFLIGFEGEHPEGATKTRKSRKAETPTGEALQAAAQMAQRVMELHAVIDEALAELSTQLEAARTAKRSTAGLHTLVEILKDHGTTN